LLAPDGKIARRLVTHEVRIIPPGTGSVNTCVVSWPFFLGGVAWTL